MQHEESSDENRELFKKGYNEVLHEMLGESDFAKVAPSTVSSQYDYWLKSEKLDKPLAVLSTHCLTLSVIIKPSFSISFP